MQTYQLVPHPSFAPRHVHAVSVRWSALPDGRLMLRYRVDGCADLVAPDFAGTGRGEDLWQTTCFELFLYDGEGRYREFNFSPSQRWAGYAFEGYRGNRRDFDPVRQPEIGSDRGLAIFTLTAFIDASETEGASRASLSAVIEEKGNRPSYWALAHGGHKPDFHDPACFRIPLGAAGSP